MADFLEIDITIKPGLAGEAEAEEDIINEFLASLYKNGQILEDYQLIKLKDSFAAYVTVPETNALDSKYNSSFTVRCLRNIETCVRNLGENLEFDAACSCSEPSWYMLYTDLFSPQSPLVCGDCGKVIPLYRVPHLPDEIDHFGILGWQEAYQSIDRLWIYGLSDRFTQRQLRDPRSQLSRTGLSICSELETLLNKPVFYYLFQTTQLTKKCPKCGGDWKVSHRTNTVDLVCEACRLAVDDVLPVAK